MTEVFRKMYYPDLTYKPEYEESKRISEWAARLPMHQIMIHMTKTINHTMFLNQWHTDWLTLEIIRNAWPATLINLMIKRRGWMFLCVHTSIFIIRKARNMFGLFFLLTFGQSSQNTTIVLIREIGYWKIWESTTSILEIDNNLATIDQYRQTKYRNHSSFSMLHLSISVGFIPCLYMDWIFSSIVLKSKIEWCTSMMLLKLLLR